MNPLQKIRERIAHGRTALSRMISTQDKAAADEAIAERDAALAERDAARAETGEAATMIDNFVGEVEAAAGPPGGVSAGGAGAAGDGTGTPAGGEPAPASNGNGGGGGE